MNATVAKYTYRVPALNRIHKLTLEQALKLLGVKPTVKTNAAWQFKLKSLDPWKLQDLFQSAKEIYLATIAVLHPDRGGNADCAAKLNALWQRIKLLFRRKGVEFA